MCEIDPAARAVLSRRFQDVPITENVASLKKFPSSVDLVTMGFPCQDLSQVGTRDGIAGRSSGIVWTALEIVRKAPPPALLIENVPFMLRLGRGEAIRRLTDELRRLGYRWAYRIVDAQAFGVPQRRPRVFIYAQLDGDPRSVILTEDAPIRQKPTETEQSAIGFYWTEGNRGLGTAIDSVPPLKGGSSFGIPSSPAILLPDGRVVTLHIRDAERLQGFAPGWTEPAETVARPGARWRLIGNSVNVLVASWIGRRIAKPRSYDSANDRALPQNGAWPSAAYNVDGTTYSASVSAFPVRTTSPGIAAYLHHDSPPLSARATRGIVTRLRNSSLRTPEGFLEALDAHQKLVEDGAHRDRRFKKSGQ